MFARRRTKAARRGKPMLRKCDLLFEITRFAQVSAFAKFFKSAVKRSFSFIEAETETSV